MMNVKEIALHDNNVNVMQKYKVGQNLVIYETCDHTLPPKIKYGVLRNFSLNSLGELILVVEIFDNGWLSDVSARLESYYPENTAMHSIEIV